MTTNDLDQAREWAEGDFDQAYIHAGPRAAAEVIQSLPGEWIDADELREVIGRWDVLLADDDHEDMHGMLDDLRALLPAPQPRTLADMTPEERKACRLMQCTTEEHHGLWVIHLIDGDLACLINEIGDWENAATSSVIPLPDLPRMVWPDEHYLTTDEDVSIIPPKIDTSTGHDDDVDMTPEDAPDGYYLVRWWGEEYPVPAEKIEGQWWVIGKPTMLPAKDVLIVSRLIPEVKA